MIDRSEHWDRVQAGIEGQKQEADKAKKFVRKVVAPNRENFRSQTDYDRAYDRWSESQGR